MSRKLTQQIYDIIPLPEAILRSWWQVCLYWIRELLYWKWVVDGYVSPKLTLSLRQKVTIVIPSYHQNRARNIKPLIRMLLTCDFVEKIVISNHNPDLHLEDWVDINDDRVVLINQPVRRGCGYVWFVAKQTNADYCIIIDDDLLLYPRQISLLFQQLLEEQEVPHGLLGEDLDGEYINRQEKYVDFLYNIYAVTKTHLQNYIKYADAIVTNGYSSEEAIEYWADDIVLSNTGTGRPKVHDVGRILQCKTTSTSGVATYVEPQFDGHRLEVYNALKKVKGMFEN